MSAFYGIPEGDEIPAVDLTTKPQAHVEPVDDENLFCAMAIPERDFTAEPTGRFGLKASSSSFGGLSEHLREGI
jgi:hypothetical protein